MMQSLSNTIATIVNRRPGISSVELAYAVFGKREQTLVNRECLNMEELGSLVRVPGGDGILRNYHPDQISD